MCAPESEREQLRGLFVHVCEYVCKNTMPGFCFVIFHNHSALY